MRVTATSSGLKTSLGLCILCICLHQTQAVMHSVPSSVEIYNSLPDVRYKDQMYRILKPFLRQEKRSAVRNIIPKLDDVAELEYDDFSENRPYWMQGEEEYVPAPNKRYLGIEIPDYVSSPSQVSMLKKISNRLRTLKLMDLAHRMKEAGK
ncbi:uncharacterized protein LOC111705540 isoform X2 [Eurytemora carolleeae]|uniref:uncharacterized protein LOC111705540 isoform X2 n=1 Tax=Eurytemora carolleeae TaxID=1294199 RepID=UPI000C78DD2D|nr:uncharacterized protein LOC111705540 isoform X2 [Eurytemora carolleeae]|eukprot:XP_023333891.1 uncharacterized protein LOC111705540 isoform X2 [Eurytemora affinis]